MLALGVAVYSMLQSLVAPVLPTITVNLHTTQNTVTWVLTAYLLSASIFTPILGRIGDAVGKKKVLLVALGALALGSLLSALADGISTMIVARAIQGVGGGILPLAFGIVRDEFPREKVSDAIGLVRRFDSGGRRLGDGSGRADRELPGLLLAVLAAHDHGAAGRRATVVLVPESV